MAYLGCLSKDALDSGRRNAMPFCDLPDALATLTVLSDRKVVQYQWSSADALAFQACAPHAGAHPFDDQVAFQLGDGADDDHDGPAQRAAGIDLLPERYELDIESVQLVQHFQEMPSRTGDPIAGPDQDDVEPAAAGVGHHLIESWPLGLHAADPVGVLLDDLIATLGGQLAQIM